MTEEVSLYREDAPSAARGHEPDLDKIPDSIRCLEWKTFDGRERFFDGQVILAAVPVCNNYREPLGGWHYQFCVVTIRCDEDYWSLENEDGDVWGWDETDIDFYATITE